VKFTDLRKAVHSRLWIRKLQQAKDLLNPDTQWVSRFQSLAQVLDFIQHHGAAVLVVASRIAKFQHERTADISKSAYQNITFLSRQFDLKHSVHHV